MYKLPIKYESLTIFCDELGNVNYVSEENTKVHLMEISEKSKRRNAPQLLFSLTDFTTRFDDMFVLMIYPVSCSLILSNCYTLAFIFRFVNRCSLTSSGYATYNLFAKSSLSPVIIN